MSQPEVPSLASLRAQWYRFFSQMYLEAPSDPWFAAVQSSDFWDDVAVMIGADTAREFRLRLFGKRNSRTWEIDAVRQEQDDLFHVPIGRYVTPFESVYCDLRSVGGHDLKGLLMGPSTVDVKRHYQQAGARFDVERFRELPDHISAELAFLSALCEQEAQFETEKAFVEREHARDAQRRFLREHLLRWVFALIDRVKAKAASDFFVIWSELLGVFLARERIELDIQEIAPTDSGAGPMEREHLRARQRMG